MSDDIQVAEPRAIQPAAQFGELSVQGVVDRKRKILEVMEAVMKPDQHYGLIPGCGPKPTLFKAGAEVLATTFGLAPRFVIVRTDLPNGHREYQVTCTLAHIATGANCGEGVGCCSTMESKYRWRGGGRKCPKCGKETIIKGKEEFGGGWLCFAKKGGCGAKWPNGAAEIEKQEVGKIENPDIADQYNTCLKMAKKRAQVDATLTVAGASDLLTQDLEDLPPASVPVVAQPSPTVARSASRERNPGSEPDHRFDDLPGPADDPEAPTGFNRAGTLRDIKRFMDPAIGGGRGEVIRLVKSLGLTGGSPDDLSDSDLDKLWNAIPALSGK